MVLVGLKSIPTTLLLDRCESTGASERFGKYLDYFASQKMIFTSHLPSHLLIHVCLSDILIPGA